MPRRAAGVSFSRFSTLSQVKRRLCLLLNSYAYKYNRDHFDGSLLTWAANHGSEIVARKMLDIGAATVISDEQRLKVMTISVENAHVEIVQLFLDRGIDLHRDLLLDAAKGGHLSVVQLMIERGKSPPSIDMAEDTLSAAAGRGNLAVVKILVGVGAYGTRVSTIILSTIIGERASNAFLYEAAINDQLEIV